MTVNSVTVVTVVGFMCAQHSRSTSSVTCAASITQWGPLWFAIWIHTSVGSAIRTRAVFECASFPIRAVIPPPTVSSVWFTWRCFILCMKQCTPVTRYSILQIDGALFLARSSAPSGSISNQILLHILHLLDTDRTTNFDRIIVGGSTG